MKITVLIFTCKHMAQVFSPRHRFTVFKLSELVRIHGWVNRNVFQVNIGKIKAMLLFLSCWLLPSPGNVSESEHGHLFASLVYYMTHSSVSSHVLPFQYLYFNSGNVAVCCCSLMHLKSYDCYLQTQQFQCMLGPSFSTRPKLKVSVPFFTPSHWTCLPTWLPYV